MYKVIGSFKSRAQRVLWALDEIGVAYDWIDASPASDLAKFYNTSGKVPALLVGDELLTDSEAILSYLCDSHDGLGYKAGTIERAHQDAQLAFAVEQIDGPLWVQLRTKRLTGEEPEALRRAVSLWLSEAFETIETEIDKGAYLSGEIFTIADIITAQSLGWAKSEGHKLPQAVLSYYRRCYARPAAKLMREKYA